MYVFISLYAATCLSCVCVCVCQAVNRVITEQSWTLSDDSPPSKALIGQQLYSNMTAHVRLDFTVSDCNSVEQDFLFKHESTAMFAGVFVGDYIEYVLKRIKLQQIF